MIFSRDIINVDLVNGLFKVKFDIRKLWYDPNVNFRNLKILSRENLKILKNGLDLVVIAASYRP